MRFRVWWIGGRRLLRLLLGLSAAALVALVLIPWMERENLAQRAQWQAEEQAAAAETRAPFAAAFADPDTLARLDFCRTAISGQLPYWRPVLALAVEPSAIDAYVGLSLRIDSLHRLSCRADGIHEARVVHPLAEAMLAARAAGLEASAAGPAIDADGLPDLWVMARQLLDTGRLDVRPSRVELVLAADLRSVLQRLDQRSDLPIDQDPIGFPSLFSSQAAPRGLAERQQTRWSSDSSVAFELLARELPRETAIVGARLDDDRISVHVRGPAAGLEAAYGSIAFDAWGELSTWLYPYEEAPGFSCSEGIDLAELKRRFDRACSRLEGCGGSTHFSIADFSCSRGRSVGDWTLHIQSR